MSAIDELIKEVGVWRNVDDATAELKAMREALKEARYLLQYKDATRDGGTCWWCGREKHADDCQLALTLAKIDGVLRDAAD